MGVCQLVPKDQVVLARLAPHVDREGGVQPAQGLEAHVEASVKQAACGVLHPQQGEAVRRLVQDGRHVFAGHVGNEVEFHVAPRVVARRLLDGIGSLGQEVGHGGHQDAGHAQGPEDIPVVYECSVGQVVQVVEEKAQRLGQGWQPLERQKQCEDCVGRLKSPMFASSPARRARRSQTLCRHERIAFRPRVA